MHIHLQNLINYKARDLYTMWLFLLGYNDENILHQYVESKKKIGSKTKSNIKKLQSSVLAIEEEIKKINSQKNQVFYVNYIY